MCRATRCSRRGRATRRRCCMGQTAGAACGLRQWRGAVCCRSGEIDIAQRGCAVRMGPYVLGRVAVKRLLVWVGVLAALLGVGAQAQDAPEMWQGTLQAGQQNIRLELQITKADGALKGRLFPVDQGGPGGMGTTTMSLDGGVLKFTMVGMDVSYEGKVTPDGKMAVGTWKQNGREIPFTLEHVNA